MALKCWVKCCRGIADNIICDEHLSEKHDLKKDFELRRNVKISPSLFVNLEKTKSQELKVGTCIMAMSPKDIKTGFKNRGVISSMKLKFEKSMDHNEENLHVIPLSKMHDAENVFYTPDFSKEDNSSENFSKFAALPDKHQLLICATSREIICFIPSLQHQNIVFNIRKQEEMMTRLKWAMRIRNNNTPKKSKNRKVLCEKWSFFGKCCFSKFLVANQLYKPLM
jgi:hypothetical protein